MTQFMWDASHYDEPLSPATLRQARDQGIVVFTHKISEGAGGSDPSAGPALIAARSAGIPLLGGYHVVRSGPVGPQVDALIGLADHAAPWWRLFPGWFWQADVELWSYDKVAAATGIAFAHELRQRTGRVVAMYASRGQYGDQLRDWDGPLWNAHYVGGAGEFHALYPGDQWRPFTGETSRGGWAAYSGREPDFLQYSSSATIAGKTTCDISAYRGTLAELTALLTGGSPMPLRDDPDFLALIKRVEALYMGLPAADFKIPNEATSRHEVNAVRAALASLQVAEGQELTALEHVASPVVDPAAVAAALVANPAFAPALAKAINDDLAHRLAS